jgi:hypothetical protein
MEPGAASRIISIIVSSIMLISMIRSRRECRSWNISPPPSHLEEGRASICNRKLNPVNAMHSSFAPHRSSRPSQGSEVRKHTTIQ